MKVSTLSLVCFAVLVVASHARASTTLATVAVNEPGDLQTWAVGQQVSPILGPMSYWNTIPSNLIEGGTLKFYSLHTDPNKSDSVAYGKLDFTVMTTGPVWMLTTTRFGGGGNSSGNWLPEVSTQAQLEANGWDVISEGVKTESGYGAFGTNSVDNYGWLLFERSSIAGETFSIRTEKYQWPVILQGTSMVPEPGGIAAATGLLGILGLRRRVRSR